MQSEEKVMKLNGNSLDEVLKKETLSDEDIVFLLGLTEAVEAKSLAIAASCAKASSRSSSPWAWRDTTSSIR